MKLDTSALRNADRNFPPIKERCVSLIQIGGGKVTQATTIAEKRAMVAKLNEEDTLIALWTGEWRTDAFQVSPDLITAWNTQFIS